MADEPGALPSNADRHLLENLVHLLQKHPFSYYHFGPWWWGIKRVLKRNGFTQRNLPHLGSYEDGDERVGEMLAGLDDAEILDHGLKAQEWAARYAHEDPYGYWPDGDPYLLHDEDLG